MKKLLSILLGVMMCTSFAVAQTHGSTSISLKKTKKGPVTEVLVPKTPEICPFSAVQTVDEVVVTAQAVSAYVTVKILSSSGAVLDVVSETLSMGQSVSLDITSLPAGAYVLTIAFDDNLYVGQFNI